MKIQFDKKTMPDALYNALLQHFVNEAVGLGVEVNKFTQCNDTFSKSVWSGFISLISCLFHR